MRGAPVAQGGSKLGGSMWDAQAQRKGTNRMEHAECAGTAHGNATATVDDAPRCTVRIHYASKSDPL